MNRVIRGSVVDEAPRFFRDGPVFVAPETEAMIEQAAAQAYEQGLQEGRRRGLAELQLGVDNLRAALTASLEQARRIHETNAAATLDAAIHIAEFVLGHAAHDEGVAITARIGEAMAELDGGPFTISVSPSDVESVTAAMAVEAGAEVIADPALAGGEARIGGPWGTAELTHQIALDAARRSFS